MKYENYYYIDGRVEIEGNLCSARLLKPYRMLPYWSNRGLSIDYRYDDDLVEDICPRFDIALSLDLFREQFQKVKAKNIFIKQKGQGLGGISLVHGYSAASTGENYWRSIDMYTMRIKRKKPQETWVFIEGTTRLVEEKDMYRYQYGTDHEFKQKKIQELGCLKFFIWFYVRDARIKDIFKDKDCRQIYEDWINKVDVM